jgi:hypothetical protein
MEITIVAGSDECRVMNGHKAHCRGPNRNRIVGTNSNAGKSGNLYSTISEGSDMNLYAGNDNDEQFYGEECETSHYGEDGLYEERSGASLCITSLVDSLGFTSLENDSIIDQDRPQDNQTTPSSDVLDYQKTLLRHYSFGDGTIAPSRFNHSGDAAAAPIRFNHRSNANGGGEIKVADVVDLNLMKQTLGLSVKQADSVLATFQKLLKRNEQDIALPSSFREIDRVIYKKRRTR